jgi:hypothetical protein
MVLLQQMNFRRVLYSGFEALFVSLALPVLYGGVSFSTVAIGFS